MSPARTRAERRAGRPVLAGPVFPRGVTSSAGLFPHPFFTVWRSSKLEVLHTYRLQD